jgi:signal transduction histidine kinase
MTRGVHEVTRQYPNAEIDEDSTSRSGLVALAILIPILLAGGALRGRPSYALTAFGDLSQLFLLAATTAFFFWRGIASQGKSRAFWFLIGLGFGMWSVSMFLWTYYEVWLDRPVPSIPIGEFLLFIKIVPMIAAFALEPNGESEDRHRLLGYFDLASLLVYWTYVFLFWAMAYLLATKDIARYNSHSDILDALGNQVFLLILGVVVYRSRGNWRRLSLHFLGAAGTYAAACLMMNHAISNGSYYTGSLYDVPFTSALAWFFIISVTNRVDISAEEFGNGDEARSSRGRRGRSVVWSARLSMVVTLSTPVIGLWLLMKSEMHDPVVHFRLLLTLLTMLLLTILLFLKQDNLNLKLGGYLREVSIAYSNVRRFEDQLVQSEKLASLGKLVARVAHEIKRAMEAVGKDVEDLVDKSGGDAARKKMTGKIGEAASRTNSLVESMLSFAQEISVQRSAVEIRPLLERAVSLTRAERRHPVRVEIQQVGELPFIEGDANQLIQVFLHLIANAIDAMEVNAGGILTIVTGIEQGQLVIGFVDTGLGLKDPHRVFEPFYTTKEVGKGVGLGLSTCYGIVRQHGGKIECYNRPEGGAVFRLVLPVGAGVPVEVAL